MYNEETGNRWLYHLYRDAIDDSIKTGEKTVKIYTEHFDGVTEKHFVNWAEEDGYRAEIKDRAVVVYLESEKDSTEVRLLDIVRKIENFVKEHGNARVSDVGFQLEIDGPCATVLNHYIKTDKGTVTIYEEQRGEKETTESANPKSVAIVCGNFTIKHTELMKWFDILKETYGDKVDFRLSRDSLLVPGRVISFVLDNPVYDFDFVFDYTESKETILKAIQGEN